MVQPSTDLSGPGPRRPATEADWEAVPPPYTGHLIGGQLYVHPRPLPGHALAATSLADELVGPFQKGRSGPGGWWILAEVDVKVGPKSSPQIWPAGAATGCPRRPGVALSCSPPTGSAR